MHYLSVVGMVYMEYGMEAWYNKMEEFYRRKYLSPSYTRTASYVDTLEKDKTVAELRKELQDCKEM